MPVLASGIVLAGGQSRRMGEDKLSLTVGGVPIIQSVHDALAEACGEVIVVAGIGEPRELPADARVVEDLRRDSEISGAGPLAGLEAGLSESRHPLTFVAAGDMPFLSPDLVSEMLRRLQAGGTYAVVPRFGGRLEPLCAAYSREALGYVGAALDGGVSAVRDLFEWLPDSEEITEDELRRFGEPELLMMNVNTSENLDLARSRAGDDGLG